MIEDDWGYETFVRPGERDVTIVDVVFGVALSVVFALTLLVAVGNC